MTLPKDVDEYISSYPQEIQQLLDRVRTSIRKAAPSAKEVISYRMPAFKQNGILVWFAAHTKHLGFYPGASGIEAFKKELSKYKGAKGSVQFPFDKPLPVGLIAKIVKFRVKEDSEKAKKRALIKG
jgi:uncharacterized protein YdhG (YjbR/CyaY superfamily)